jgi:hypothetical protein
MKPMNTHNLETRADTMMTNPCSQWSGRTARRSVPLALTSVILALALSCAPRGARHAERVFATPEEAVRTLLDVAKAGNLDALVAIFGPDSRELVASSDPATARANREVFIAAAAERWQLVDAGSNTKTLVIGHEAWPFPIPLVSDASGWRFDTAAGKEEVLARRIGRNELAAIQACRTYVTAQRLYARRGHDGNRAGLYAATFRSDPGRQNGLYWPTKRGEKRSPLGDLVAQAAAEGTQLDRDDRQQVPFHGYFFRILTGQGPNAPGGAKDYVVNGKLSDGFALIAWPAEYDVTGVMTFVVNQSGSVYEKDLGAETASQARAVALFNPDTTWSKVN